MDDYLEEMLDQIDAQEEIMATMDDDTVWEESADFRLMCRECDLTGQEDISAYL